MASRKTEDLHASIRDKAVEFLKRANAALKQISPTLEVRLVQTWRSQAEQNALYAQGRTKPGRKVTWTKSSAHNTDLPETPHGDAEAFDIGVFDGSKYLTGATKKELDYYRQLGPIGEALGLVWGGRWQTPDLPHYERKDWRVKR